MLSGPTSWSAWRTTIGEVPYASAAIKAKKKPTATRGLNVGLRPTLPTAWEVVPSDLGTCPD